MLIKFNGKTMPRYAGIDGNGGIINLKAGDEAQVSECVGNALIRAYKENFEIVIERQQVSLVIKEQQLEHAFKKDKRLRKTKRTRAKSRQE